MSIKILLACVSVIFLASCSLFSDEHPMSFAIPDNYVTIDNTDPITVSGKQVQLSWDRLQIWDNIQDTVLDKRADYFDQVETTSLANFPWIIVLETVPSLDTPVCTMQTKQLEFAAGEFTDIHFVVISNDTPFALQRFCSANKIRNLHTLSDARSREFWKQNGLLLEEYGLLTRSIMILDEDKKVQYIEYASEVTQELDLMNALAFLQKEIIQ